MIISDLLGSKLSCCDDEAQARARAFAQIANFSVRLNCIFSPNIMNASIYLTEISKRRHFYGLV